GFAAADLAYRPSPGQEDRLRQALRAAVAKESEASARPSVAAERGARRPWQQWGAIAAMVLATVGVFGLGRWWGGRAALSPADLVADEVVASHERSLLAAHLEDVATSDRHTVKPWFNGKLDYAPPVIDLAKSGFPLRGGRLDLIDHRRVAAVVYQSDHHWINLFVLPATRDEESREVALRGYTVVSWTAAGMSYFAVSDVEAEKLREFARQIRAATSTPKR
ncbi:MAG TPA: anti-sigma factor, partial [Thermoanaerobaculia bacterium]